MQNILIIGANSAIAREVARIHAARHCQLFLIARDAGKLQQQADDLLIRGAQSAAFAQLDVNDFDRHADVIAQAVEKLGRIDLALICHGSLPVQASCEHDFAVIKQVFDTNTLSVISLLAQLAPQMIRQGSGHLAVITSVAGDRGRKSNYVYGSSKGAVSRYLQGLRACLLPHRIDVTDIKPGFVDTPMTRDFPKGRLWAQPEVVAIAIIKGIEAGRTTLYVPWYWRYIMLIVGSIPEALFKRLNI